MKIALFFTYGISLNDWDSSGILTELEIYKKFIKKTKVVQSHYLWQNKDRELLNFEGMRFSVYSRLKYSKNNI